MKKLLAVVLILIPCVAVLLAPLGATAFFFSPGGSGGGGSATTNASDLSSGVVAAARGGTGSGRLSTARTNIGLGTGDNVTFNTVIASEFVSSAADNTRGVTVPNTADPTGVTLAAGKIWVTDNSVKVRSNDNTVTFIAGSLIKAKSFGWDNAATTDNNIFLGTEWSPVATTLISIKCFASADNVIGVLSECASDNNASCTKVDNTDWTITSAVTGVTVLAADFENAAIAAGASLKWTTTSVGSALNRFSCTVRYRE